MLRITFIILIAVLCSCNNGSKAIDQPNQEVSKQIPSSDKKNDELKLKTKFNSFDTTVEVLFWDTKDSISEIQRKNYEGFLSKQDILTPDILKSIFEFYKTSYPDYKKGWTMNRNISDAELEKYLPKPTTPEALKKFISPTVIYIDHNKYCKLGTIGIEFDCTWDIENGLGVKIQNWKVSETGVAETSYFFHGD